MRWQTVVDTRVDCREWPLEAPPGRLDASIEPNDLSVAQRSDGLLTDM
jgi:hypothetical protein